MSPMTTSRQRKLILHNLHSGPGLNGPGSFLSSLSLFRKLRIESVLQPYPCRVIKKNRVCQTRRFLLT